MQTISLKRRRVPSEIIRRAVWLSAWFTLIYRDIEDLLSERDLDIFYETVRRSLQKFGGPIACNLRQTHPTPSDHLHLDEVAIVICGKRHWLWRAVDNEDEVLDFLV
jgi:putative transposase